MAALVLVVVLVLEMAVVLAEGSFPDEKAVFLAEGRLEA